MSSFHTINSAPVQNIEIVREKSSIQNKTSKINYYWLYFQIGIISLSAAYFGWKVGSELALFILGNK